MCRVSHITSCVSPVTCHKRQQPQPLTLPLLTPPLCSVCWLAKTRKSKKNIHNMKNHLKRQKPKNFVRFAILAIPSSTRSLQSNRKQGFRHGTDRHTHALTRLTEIAT